MGIILVHVLLYGQIYYSEEVVENPPSLHLYLFIVMNQQSES